MEPPVITGLLILHLLIFYMVQVKRLEVVQEAPSTET